MSLASVVSEMTSDVFTWGLLGRLRSCFTLSELFIAFDSEGHAASALGKLDEIRVHSLKPCFRPSQLNHVR